MGPEGSKHARPNRRESFNGPSTGCSLFQVRFARISKRVLPEEKDSAVEWAEQLGDTEEAKRRAAKYQELKEAGKITTRKFKQGLSLRRQRERQERSLSKPDRR